MDDDSENKLFEMQKKRTLRTMKIMITLLAAVFLFVFYYLVLNG